MSPLSEPSTDPLPEPSEFAVHEIAGAEEDFIYTPLGQEEIRLLILYAASRDEPLNFALVAAHLNDLPDFDALSYCWGSETRPNRIRCRHAGTPKLFPKKGPRIYFSPIAQYVNITDNLRDALLDIRSEHVFKLVWVDSICINQADISERNTQVELMHKIYGRAEKVLIYIGDSDRDTLLTFNFMRSLSNGRTKLDDDVRFWGPGIYEQYRNKLGSIRAKFSDRDPWVGYTDLLARPWFTRLWTWQEVILSSQPFVVCGQHWIEWETFAMACTIVVRAEFHQNDSRFCRSAPVANMDVSRARLHHYQRFLETERIYYQPPENITAIASGVKFSTLLTASRTQQSSDPRDKVFGILNISKIYDKQVQLAPDYTLSVREVYIKAVRAWYQEAYRDHRSQRRQALQFLHYVDGLPNAFNLPSWVPNWSRRISTTPFTDHRFGVPCNATKEAESLSNFPDASTDKDTLVKLSIRGATMTTVKGAQDIEIDDHTTIIPLLKHYPNGILPYSTVYFHLLWPLHCTFEWEKAQRKPFWEFKKNDALSNITTPPEEARQTQKQLLKMVRDEAAASAWPEGIVVGRSLIVTDEGYLGLGPQSTGPGDEIVLLFGLDTPFVVRRVDDCFSVIGECYLAGVMDGEAMEALPEEHVKDFVFV